MKETDKDVNDFNSSISFDWVMYQEDIEGSLAHAKMLCAVGIISAEDLLKIESGLAGILADINSGALEIDPGAEDIHMFIEAQLTQRVGDAGKRLHTARSRNDQVATDLRLYLRKKAHQMAQSADALARVMVKLASRHTNSLMPGYTHMQVAQPTTFAHHLMAYAQMLRRDISRIEDATARMNECPLGAGAIAGTAYPIDRAMTAEALHFATPCANSMDAVSDRDFCLELAAVAGIMMSHLSRLAEELVLWCSSEFAFIELDDAFATGSSMMPQKKNPDVAELVRGKAGRVQGQMVALFTMMKGLPLAYNKDMQEDKPAIFDAIKTTLLCLSAMAPMMESMKVKPENMRKAAARGFINATDCADYLVKKGLPFRDAYKVTGQLVARCIKEGQTLESLSLSAYEEASALFGRDIFDAVDLSACLNGRCSQGGPAPKAVERQIAEYIKAMGWER